MIRLRNILTEAFELDEAAKEEAHRQGLEYMSFGRWGKDGKVTHKSSNGKLVPVATTPSSKTVAPSRSTGKSNQSALAQAKLRDASRAKDPDYDEKSAQRPAPARDVSRGGGEQETDTIGYDYSDPGLGGGRAIQRGPIKPDMKPREEFKKFTSKNTGKTYAWKWDTPDDIAPTLPGRSSDGGEWLDSMGKGMYGKNGVVTHREDGKKLTPLNKK